MEADRNKARPQPVVLATIVFYHRANQLFSVSRRVPGMVPRRPRHIPIGLRLVGSYFACNQVRQSDERLAGKAAFRGSPGHNSVR
jgi:hypothetical protein